MSMQILIKYQIKLQAKTEKMKLNSVVLSTDFCVSLDEKRTIRCSPHRKFRASNGRKILIECNELHNKLRSSQRAGNLGKTSAPSEILPVSSLW